jgi:hypothetical protein
MGGVMPETTDMTTLSDAQLVDCLIAERDRTAEKPVGLTLNVDSLMMLMSLVELGLQHPDCEDVQRAFGQQFSDQVTELSKRELPALAEAVRRGRLQPEKEL